MQTRYKWKVEDYHQLLQTGLLEDKPVELLEGELIEISPEGVPHSFTNRTVADYLRTLLHEKAIVSEAHPITLDNSEPEPDIAIIRLPQEIYKQHHPYPEDIYWLVEVANRTLEKDLQIKSVTYARNNIPEYWVIDLPHKKLWLFTQPTVQGYAQTQELMTGEITPQSLPEIAIAIDELLLY